MPPDPTADTSGVGLTWPHAGLRAVGETVPALVVAVLLLPWIIAGGTLWPWRPAMIDLDVYLAAVADLLAGESIYLTRTPGWNLPFIYPPVAALLLLPLSLLPLWAAQLVWTVLTILAQQLVLVRAGVPRGTTLAVVNVVLVIAFEPFRTTLGYGQVNTLLMALVVADLLPAHRRPRTVIPRGALIGLAAAIKLTPLAFLAFALLAGRRRIALTGAITFLALTAVGAAALPNESARFAGKLMAGDLYGDPFYVGNQSISAVLARLTENSDTAVGLATFAGALVAAAALIAAVRWSRRGGDILAVGLIGLATCLASPLSWTHHHVWALLIGLVALDAGLPLLVRVLALVWTGWVAMCPMLVFLPYAAGAELRHTVGQSVVANLGPVLGVLLVVALLAVAPNHLAGADRAPGPRRQKLSG